MSIGTYTPAKMAAQRPKNHKYPYGKTEEEKRDFALKFSKLAGTMTVSDLAKEMGINEKQVNSFSTRSGWSIKYVSNT